MGRGACTRRCVEGADHHCPVVNTCVGRANLRVFLAYIVTLFAAQVLPPP